MPNVERVMRAAFQSDESLREALKEVFGELGLSAREFSKASEIPQSTLYKILSGHREPNITTLRLIVKTIRKLEGSEGNFIAIGPGQDQREEDEDRRQDADSSRVFGNDH
jgi:predicted transcriptional regulator